MSAAKIVPTLELLPSEAMVLACLLQCEDASTALEAEGSTALRSAGAGLLSCRDARRSMGILAAGERMLLGGARFEADASKRVPQMTRVSEV